MRKKKKKPRKVIRIQDLRPKKDAKSGGKHLSLTEIQRLLNIGRSKPNHSNWPTTYDWTVPNTPTNAAVLDIRFGREVPYYPETYSPQPASTFVIR